MKETLARQGKGNSLHIGAAHFMEGARLLTHPKLRPFIIIPILVNVVIFVALIALIVTQFDKLPDFDWNLPAWLDFLEKTLKWTLWFLLVVVFLIAYGYGFNMLTGIFAAPFYGLLAQRTEELLTGKAPDDEPLIKMIPRTIFREIKKLVYFITRGIFIFLLIVLLGTIPILNLAVPLIGALWSAWCMALQYADYAADNHRTDFPLLRKKLRHCKYSSVGFGGMIMGCSMVPVVNIFAMPAAVIGGTVYWLEELAELQRKSTTTPQTN